MAPQVVGVPSPRKTHVLSCRTATRTAGFSTAVVETHADNADEKNKNAANLQVFSIIVINDHFIFIQGLAQVMLTKYRAVCIVFTQEITCTENKQNAP
jgi:hypothetical protein